RGSDRVFRSNASILPRLPVAAGTSGSAGPDPADVGAERLQLPGEVGVAAVHVEGIEHEGLAVGGEAGDHEGGTRSHVLSADRRARQPVDTAHDRVTTLVADVG